MCDHVDSPYIRGIGFLYLRYRCAYCNFLVINLLFSLPPENLLEYLEPYFKDTEEIDPKAGGGDPMTMGELVSPEILLLFILLFVSR